MALKPTYALLTMNSTVYWNNGGRSWTSAPGNCQEREVGH